MKTKTKITTKVIGKLGEDVACLFLMKHGYTVVTRNYYRKWGEIDIVAERSGILYFIEVKSVTSLNNVNHETKRGEYRPEDNIHQYKLRKLSRIVDTYLHEKKIETEWRFLAITVKLNMETRRAKVEIMKDFVL